MSLEMKRKRSPNGKLFIHIMMTLAARYCEVYSCQAMRKGALQVVLDSHEGASSPSWLVLNTLSPCHAGVRYLRWVSIPLPG
jgi:hypothetical protein